MKVNIVGKLVIVELTLEEAQRLLGETQDIEVGRRPLLHELLDRIAEILGENSPNFTHFEGIKRDLHTREKRLAFDSLVKHL